MRVTARDAIIKAALQFRSRHCGFLAVTLVSRLPAFRVTLVYSAVPR